MAAKEVFRLYEVLFCDDGYIYYARESIFGGEKTSYTWRWNPELRTVEIMPHVGATELIVTAATAKYEEAMAICVLEP